MFGCMSSVHGLRNNYFIKMVLGRNVTYHLPNSYINGEGRYIIPYNYAVPKKIFSSNKNICIQEFLGSKGNYIAKGARKKNNLQFSGSVRLGLDFFFTCLNNKYIVFETRKA